MGCTAMSGREVYAVHAACIRGVEAFAVTVEVSMAEGIPGITIVGMADSTVQEARSRIRCALRSTGFEIPRKSITVNLSPSDMRKTGAGLDLPIAVAILALSKQIPQGGLEDYLFFGEIALDGSILATRGEVPYQILAREMGLDLVGGEMRETVSLPNVNRFVVLGINAFRGGKDSWANFRVHGEPVERYGSVSLDYADVVGQEIAKRGMMIAAVGEHGLMMIGTPGAGKSMLAQRLCGILPPIDDAELQEALSIHSVVDEPLEGLLCGQRPFRRPHHSISAAGLLGGNRPVRPGEASLAHGGVLFLEEMGEWPSHVLQMLRQPIEEGVVRIIRADGSYIFPARFQLLAASNPCPCGYLGDPDVECRCTPAAVERYQTKLSGPLADRIDISIAVMRPSAELIVRGSEGMSTAEMQARVLEAREFGSARLQRATKAETPDASSSAEASVRALRFDDSGLETLLTYSKRNLLTARGIVRLARVARTVADLSQSDCVTSPHVLEAAMFQGRARE